jgi:sugar-specific transcriptional regulator TrmB/predicted hydrocarbon binding protein
LAHGVPEPAARIYLAAAHSIPRSAAELARATAIHRVHGYRFIRLLVDQGLLLGTGQRPMRFTALPPQELIDRWIGESKTELEHLERDRDHLLDEVHDSAVGPGGDGHRFAVIEGQPAIIAFLRKRIGAARREVLMAVAGFSIARAIDGGIDRELVAARKRGVKVRVVTEVSPSNVSEVKLFMSGAEMRHAGRSVTNRAIMIDREMVALFISGEDGLGPGGGDQILITTSDPHFLELTREYHQRLWGHSTPATQRLVEIEAPLRATLPLAKGQMEDGFARLKEIAELGMTATGLDEISIDLPDLIEAFADQIGKQIGASLEGRTPREIASALAEFYRGHAGGRLSVVREKPLTLKVTDCFACKSSPEIGRVLCPRVIQSVFRQRLGGTWDVTKPDPRRHATRGCLFTITAE